MKMLFGRKNKSGGTVYDYIIVFLGNPGAKYEMTRHNAGFLAADMLAIKEGFDIKKLKYHALTADVRLGGKRCLIMKPQTMMNNSGEAVGEAVKFYNIPPERVIAVFDDITLDVGKIRVRRKGSAGGHNGVKSLIAHIGSENFPRVKIGVGKKPDPEYDLVDWVLGKFPKQQESQLKTALENAVSAVELLVDGKTDEAMNLYN
ncbi:MAG: aminoacyl-tRNA hydrolase [Clostridiales bacterium]|nr:aminoacyl-tRNA hydrolase [Clostridiales bacterium]